MGRTLVNGLGEAKTAKVLKSNSVSEQNFLWKHNFQKIDCIRLKKEMEIYKVNAEKSKATKQNFTLWKNGEYKIKRIFNKSLHHLEAQLVKKGILTIEESFGDVAKVISYDSIVKTIEEFQRAKDETIELLNSKKEEIIIHKSNGEKEMYMTLMNEIKVIVKNFSTEATTFSKSAVDSKKIEMSSGIDARKEEYSILKEAKKRKKSVKFGKATIMPGNLTFFDKKNLNPSQNLKIQKRGEVVARFLKDKASTSYEIEYQYKTAKINEKNSEILIEKKRNWATKLSEALDVLSVKKQNQNSYSEKMKQLICENKEQRKIEWNSKKIEMKASSSSKNAKAVEKKRIFNKYKSQLRVHKLESNPILKARNDVKIIRTDLKNDLKMQKKLHENELKDALLQTPFETTKVKTWISMIFGSIFPGVGSFIIGKKIKGIIQLATTALMILIIAWIFGAFPSSSGNGLMGLQTLGYDPKTAFGSTIGLTNGVANDGRFYLVSGTLAIIMLMVAIMYWLVSILDNINQVNATRLGMRPAGWKDQKKLLKTQGLPYLLSLPAMIFIIFIVLLPLMATILISFTNFGQSVWDPATKTRLIANGTTNKFQWVGGEQFKLIFTVMGPEIKTVFVWTIIWTIGSTMTLLVIGTFFALIVNQKRIKFKNLFRVIYILPWAVPAFITILYFSIFFAHDGPFNQAFGITTDWAQAGSRTKVLMIFMQGWLGHSYIFLLVTGMIQSIPKSLYEASRIDGASNFRQFRTITAPIILSKIAPLLVGQFVFNFNNFGLIYLFNSGGITEPGKTAGAQDIFISWIYKLVSGNNARPGAAAAMSLFISVFTVTPSAFIFVRNKAFRKGA